VDKSSLVVSLFVDLSTIFWKISGRTNFEWRNPLIPDLATAAAAWAAVTLMTRQPSVTVFFQQQPLIKHVYHNNTRNT
jgi:hypothetical protein